MEKYFEKNQLDGADLITMHKFIVDASGVVCKNLFFQEAEDDGDTHLHRSKLAMSCYNLIAICEAIVETYCEDTAPGALEDVRGHFSGDRDEYEEALQAVKKIFGL